MRVVEYLSDIFINWLNVRLEKLNERIDIINRRSETRMRIISEKYKAEERNSWIKDYCN